MKKLRNIIIVILLTALIPACYGASFFALKEQFTPHGHFTQDEKLDPVNGDKFPSGYYYSMGIKNGKLYYEHQGYDDFSKRGIYEIDENGCRLTKYDIDMDGIEALFPDTKTSDETDELKIIDKIKDVYVYNAKDDPDGADDENLYLITDDVIIYLNKDLYIKEIDRKTNKCLFSKKLKKNIIPLNNLWECGFILCGDRILLYSNKDYSELNIYDVTNGYKKLLARSLDDYSSFSHKHYKNKLFLGFDDGVYSLDLDTREFKRLTWRSADGINIFGNKWVYFSDDRNSLYRVAQNGSKEEKLFGLG